MGLTLFVGFVWFVDNPLRPAPDPRAPKRVHEPHEPHEQIQPHGPKPWREAPIRRGKSAPPPRPVRVFRAFRGPLSGGLGGRTVLKI
jgi:hypothetical protein